MATSPPSRNNPISGAGYFFRGLSLITQKGVKRYVVIPLLINILLLVIGTFMEALAAIVILVPILMPIVTKVGVDPIHFGVIMVVNLAIGFTTPPVGVNLFVASSVAKVKLEDVSRRVFPILGLMIIVLLAVTYIPALSLLLIGE